MFRLDTGETGLICFGCFGLTDELLHSFTFGETASSVMGALHILTDGSQSTSFGLHFLDGI